MWRGPPASLLAVLSGDNESELFYAAVNTQEHDPHERKREVGKGSEGPQRREDSLNSKKKNYVATSDKMDRKDLMEEFGGERGEKEEKRITTFPFTPLSPANLLRNKLTSVSA